MSKTSKTSTTDPAARTHLATLLVAVVVLGCVAGKASAQESQWRIRDLFEIHGFGSWVFGKTDGNRYLVGNQAGDFENADFSLNLTAAPQQRLKVVTQIQFEGEQEELDLDVDYAFVEWSFSSPLRVRGGRVKHPFGIYADVFDVGTLRPFLMLPQGIYGPQGFTAESYNGLGLSGDAVVPGGWELAYDVYGGQIEAVLEHPPFSPADRQAVADGKVSSDFQVNDILGARINFLTPADGLMFGLSGYRGHSDLGVDGGGAVGYRVYGTHVEYLDERWWVRSEYARIREDGAARGNGSYLEVAYRLSRHWQVAARYDRWELELLSFPNPPPVLQAILSHQDWGVALNYWLTPGIVFKLNLHLVDGNRFAFPEDSQTILDVLFGRQLGGETELIMIGTQLSF